MSFGESFAKIVTLDDGVVNLEAGVLTSAVRVEMKLSFRAGHDERRWTRVIAVETQSFVTFARYLRTATQG